MQANLMSLAASGSDLDQDSKSGLANGASWDAATINEMMKASLASLQNGETEF